MIVKELQLHSPIYRVETSMLNESSLIMDTVSKLEVTIDGWKVNGMKCSPESTRLTNEKNKDVWYINKADALENLIPALSNVIQRRKEALARSREVIELKEKELIVFKRELSNEQQKQ